MGWRRRSGTYDRRKAPTDCQWRSGRDCV